MSPIYNIYVFSKPGVTVNHAQDSVDALLQQQLHKAIMYAYKLTSFGTPKRSQTSSPFPNTTIKVKELGYKESRKKTKVQKKRLAA